MIAIAAAVIVVALVTAFVTYRAELWGGTSLPDAAQIAAETSEDGSDTAADEVTADQAAKALESRGLKSKRVYEFSARDKGIFLGYVDRDAGQRVADDSTVELRVSAGPGVPQGTVGSQVSDVVDSLESMGVPVQYKQVAVSDSSDRQPGEVVVTSPADGTALADDQLNEGIYVGVAGDEDGIPVDILGMDVDDASDLLESLGYSVDIEARFTSSDYIGKVADSDPGPGSSLSSGSTVTLYYGVDVSSEMDLLTTTSSSGNQVARGDLSILAGQYCKATVTDSEDCITLETAQEPSYFSDAGNTAIRIAGHDDSMVLYNYNQNIELSMLVGGEAVESGSVDYDSLPMRNHLLFSGWGMFEVYAGQGVANCGTEQLDDWDSAYCVDGTYHTFDPSDGVPDDLSYTGITYDMQDFIVYFPVGSDIDALEASGYFDEDALAEAEAQDDVDTSRPFILVRDPSLYDTTSVDVDDVDVDPFVPGNQDGDNPLVAMKPAISNDTVYYLVENAEPDWDSLPDADVDTTNADAAQ